VLGISARAMIWTFWAICRAVSVMNTLSASDERRQSPGFGPVEPGMEQDVFLRSVPLNVENAMALDFGDAVSGSLDQNEWRLWRSPAPRRRAPPFGRSDHDGMTV